MAINCQTWQLRIKEHRKLKKTKAGKEGVKDETKRYQSSLWVPFQMIVMWKRCERLIQEVHFN
jgi:hypothetical protein